MRIHFALMAALLVVQGLAAQERAPQNDSIRKEDLKPDLYFLAHDLTRGRLVGTPEVELAAEFVRSRFERLGLTPAGSDGSYFHSFNLNTMSLGADNAVDIIESDQATIRLRVGQDFYPHRFGASGRIKGPLVFVGFGITSPALQYDDYRGADVKGKIVLVLDHEPGERDPA